MNYMLYRETYGNVNVNVRGENRWVKGGKAHRRDNHVGMTR